MNRYCLIPALPALWVLLCSCALVGPLPRETSLGERLAVFPGDAPLRESVTVSWDEHQVPFIEAQTDEDLALALGMVHAHLRSGQMELLRRASRGRLAEGMGPWLVPVDHALRLMDFGATTPEIIAMMPGETRVFLEHFVEGVNHYQARQHRRPVEHRVLKWDFEPWTLDDLVTMSRLAAIDITWLYALRTLSLQEDPAWEEFWRRTQRLSGESIPSFRLPHSPDAPETAVEGAGPPPRYETAFSREARLAFDHLLGQTRSGSNAIAVSRGGAGAPLFAADPHVGLQVPPLWLLAGMRSPSYHVVGFMLPGLPIIAIGRNEGGAWGGTNMLSQSSDFVELPPGWEPTSERGERIAVRGWFSREVDLRWSEAGPVISDLPFFEREEGRPELALRWAGHDPSDEFTVFLRAARARDWEEFRTAFESYSVSGQNFVYAGTDGTIGQLMGTRLPRRPNGVQERFSVPWEEAREWWSDMLGPHDLPSFSTRGPAVLVSTNNSPVDNSPVPVSRFFSSNDRQGRLLELLAEPETMTLERLREIQNDVVSPEYRAIARAVVPHLIRGTSLRGHLERWDGAFTPDSRAALMAHLLVGHLAGAWYRELYGESIASTILSRDLASAFLLADLENDHRAPGVLRHINRAASATYADLGELPPGATWGDFHRLTAAHAFSNLPVVGGRYVFTDDPASGNTLTVRKAATGLGGGPGRASYGQNARSLFDLSDPDENYFVLFGGQDGWINSVNSTDQVGMFLREEMIRLPLRPDLSSRRSMVIGVER